MEINSLRNAGEISRGIKTAHPYIPISEVGSVEEERAKFKNALKILHTMTMYLAITHVL